MWQFSIVLLLLRFVHSIIEPVPALPQRLHGRINQFRKNFAFRSVERRRLLRPLHSHFTYTHTHAHVRRMCKPHVCEAHTHTQHCILHTTIAQELARLVQETISGNSHSTQSRFKNINDVDVAACPRSRRAAKSTAPSAANSAVLRRGGVAQASPREQRAPRNATRDGSARNRVRKRNEK